MMPTTMLEMENKLLDKIEAISRNLGEVAIALAGLREKVDGISINLHESRQHGDRITKLETEVVNLKSNEKSAATERRWIVGTIIGVIGVLVMATIAVAGLLFQMWGKGHG